MNKIFLSTFSLSFFSLFIIGLTKTNVNEQCRSFSDPNIITFDGMYYKFHLEGDHFILFDDLKDTRVTIGYEKSGENSTRNCAVYVKKGRRLLFVDICAPISTLHAASKFYGVWVQKNRVGLKSIRDPPICPILAIGDEDSKFAWDNVPRYINNFKCARLQGSNHYDTYLIRTYEQRFEDTVKVQIKMSNRQIIDVRVEAPHLSYNTTGGLCGKWDNDKNRELFILDRDGVEHYIDHKESANIKLIGDFWKLHSRYNKDMEKSKKKRCPECYVMSERSFYCPCDDFDLFDITNYNILKPNRTTYCKIPMGLCLKKLLELNSTCFDPLTTIAPITVIEPYDTTTYWDIETTLESNDDTTSDVESTKETTYEESLTTLKPSITTSQASEICTNLILQNPTISYFVQLGNLNVEFNIEVCINDIVSSQDENAALSHVAYIKDEIINLLLVEAESTTLNDLSEELLSGLCPNDCSQNGNCTLDYKCLNSSLNENCLAPLKCTCNQPYGGKDCSRDLTEIAELNLDRACCDLRKDNCELITGIGCTYDNDDTIYVKIELIEQEPNGTIHVVEQFTTAEKVNYQELKIKIERLNELTLFANINNLPSSFQSAESTAIANIYISYLNDSFTQYTSFVLYDSLCRECSNNGTSLLLDRCEIDGKCYKANQTLETNVNFICDPEIDPYEWTLRPTPDPLCPTGYWTEWFNLDDPSGDGDLELFGLFDDKYGCKNPSNTIIQTVDGVPFNETGQTLHVNDCFGFMCLNNINSGGCLDYQIKQCCPIIETLSPKTTISTTTLSEYVETTEQTTREETITQEKTTAATANRVIDCRDLWADGERDNGYYTIYPDGENSFEVYCDMEEGGWTVVLNRVPHEKHENKANSFYQDFENYQLGFGEARENFWLGLKPLRNILERSSRTELRVKVGNSNSHIFKNEDPYQHYAIFWSFSIENEINAYEMRLGEKYEGDLFDVSRSMNGRLFSTRDHDLTDNDCSQANEASWWFDAETCATGGMCLTCTHRHYFNGHDDESRLSSYDEYNHIQMAIRSFKNT